MIHIAYYVGLVYEWLVYARMYVRIRAYDAVISTKLICEPRPHLYRLVMVKYILWKYA